MLLSINKLLLLESITRSKIINTSTNCSDKLKELKTLLKKANIPEKNIYIFGSYILELNHIRCANDLDVSIPQNDFKKLMTTFGKKHCASGSYCVQYDIGNISFIDERAVPKSHKTFILHNNIKVIDIRTWLDMYKKDPDKKDKSFLSGIKKLIV